MKTVREVFRDAIKQGSWPDVCKVYTKITGEEAPPFPANNDVLDEVMVEAEVEPAPQRNILDEPMAEDHPVPSKAGELDFSMPQKPRNRVQGQQQQCRREPLGAPQNTWEDDGTEHANESVKVRPELGVQNARPRTDHRDPQLGIDTGGKVAVVCALCGKTESVAPRLAVGHDPNPDKNTYRCNDCLSPKSRRKTQRM